MNEIRSWTSVLAVSVVITPGVVGASLRRTLPSHLAFWIPAIGRQVLGRFACDSATRQPARRRRRELVTTMTLEAAMAAPAIIGLSSPAAASGIAATL